MRRLLPSLLLLALAGCNREGLGGGGPDLALPDLARGGPADFAHENADFAGVGDDYYAVWGSGPNDVWIAGAHGTLLHGSAGNFAQVAGIPDVMLFGVSGGIGVVIAVGEQGAILRSTDRGASFQPVASPAGAVNLYAVSTLFGRDVWIVGDSGVALVSGDSGATFALQDLGTNLDLRGVRVFSNGDGASVFAVGKQGVVARFETARPPATIATLPGGHDANAVWAIGPGSAWAVGDAHSIEGSGETTWRWDGTRWQVDLFAPGTVLLGVDATGGDNLWAVGNHVYYHHDANGWKARGAPQTLRGAWAYGTEVYLVGDARTILHNPPVP
jgi:hypothetical protein